MDTAITKKLSTLATDVSQRLGEVSPAAVYKYAALVLGAFAVKFVASELIVSFRCRHIPCPSGRIPVLGHALKLLKGNVWDTFTSYALQYASIYRMHVLGRVFIVISDPKHIKHVLQTNIQNYRKDRSAYGVFDCLLGTGIVTSEGHRWQRLRRELAPTFKLEILEDVARAAEEVTKRLYLSLDKACETGEIVDMAEHFRKLTLQVIAMAVLGCTPEESDAEISDLYMPIIDECNDRIWYPHRIYLPTLAWLAHNRLVRSLNQYLEGKVRARWALRVKREEQALPQNPPEDILDRILANIDPVEFRKNGNLLRRLLYHASNYLLHTHTQIHSPQIAREFSLTCVHACVHCHDCKTALLHHPDLGAAQSFEPTTDVTVLMTFRSISAQYTIAAQ